MPCAGTIYVLYNLLLGEDGEQGIGSRKEEKPGVDLREDREPGWH